MAGRHRATPSRPARGRHRTHRSSWVRPLAVGVVAAGALAVTVHTASGLFRGDGTVPAGLAMTPGTPTIATPATRAPEAPDTRSRTTSTTPTTPKEPEPTPEPDPTTESGETSESGEGREEPTPAPAATPELAPCSTELEGTEPHVAQVGHHVLGEFDVDAVGGRADRPNASDHPLGLALDFMVIPDVGDPLAEYLLDHRDEFGITYVIWEQRIDTGNGWTVMEDRGSPTANHLDHVHVSFAAGADVSVTC